MQHGTTEELLAGPGVTPAVTAASPRVNGGQQADRFSKRLREPRYLVCRDAWRRVTVEGAADSQSVELIDVSPHGAKFTSSTLLQPDDKIRLKAVTGKADIELDVEGEVRWSAPSADGYWTGCYFPRPIDEQVLQQLAVSGCLDRRDSDRIRTRIKVRLREELSGESAEPATIVDYSAQGARLRVESAKEPDQRLLAELPGEATAAVPLRVVWSRQTGDGWEIGCRFPHRAAFEVVHGSDLDRRPSLRKVVRALQMEGVWWVGLVTIIALAFLSSLEGLRLVLLWCSKL